MLLPHKVQYLLTINGILYYKKERAMKPLKNRYSITLDEDIAEKIKRLAEEDDRSFSQYINMVLRDWLKNRDDSDSAK